MIDKLALRFMGDLVRSKDGSCSLTKLASVTAHFNAAWLFVYLTWTKGFMIDLWIAYTSITIFHATIDKGMKVWQSTKVSKNENPDSVGAGS